MAEEIEITKERYDEIKKKELSQSNLDVYETYDDQEDIDDMISSLEYDGILDEEFYDNIDPDSIEYDPNATYIFTTPDNSLAVDKSYNGSMAPNNGGFNADDYKMNGSTLTENDYKKAASILGVEVAVIKAVTFVESGGRGFDNNKRPKILFEAHWFGKFTNYKYMNHPDISAKKWADAKPYYKNDQYQRLDKASKLDKESAQKSASWGLFQIMGFNYGLAGYTSVDSYVKAMFEGEGKHLEAFARFVKNNKKMKDALANKDWATFAYRYNGAGYKQNAYDTKLANAYNRFKSQS